MHAVVNLQGLADKIDRVKNAQTGIVQGCAKFMGLGFACTPYPKMQGLANKIDRVKNVRARMVQSSWD